MDTVETRYGMLQVHGPVDRHPDGSVRAVFLETEQPLDTPLGRLVPQHTIDDSRRMEKPPVTFHPNGVVRSLPLERRTVLSTPAGPLPAELVTFHDNGAVARVFPLNGKLTGYWTEADEAALAEVLRIDTSAGRIEARFLSVAFDARGGLRSLTLWPREEVIARTPVGNVPVRLGLSFHPDGSLRSIEPARPLETPTPAGPVWAFDPDAVGISGDDNSLCFAPSGEVVRVATVRTALAAELPDKTRREFAPAVRESICGDGDHELTPLVAEFAAGTVTFRHGTGRPLAVIPRAGAILSARPFVSAFSVPFAPKQCSM